MLVVLIDRFLHVRHEADQVLKKAYYLFCSVRSLQGLILNSGILLTRKYMYRVTLCIYRTEISLGNLRLIYTSLFFLKNFDRLKRIYKGAYEDRHCKPPFQGLRGRV